MWLFWENVSPRMKLPAPTTMATWGPSLQMSLTRSARDSSDEPLMPNSPGWQKLSPESLSSTRLYLHSPIDPSEHAQHQIPNCGDGGVAALPSLSSMFDVLSAIQPRISR